MKLKFIVDEDVANYKKISMFIGFPTCTWKCGIDYCQNSDLALGKVIDISKETLCERYVDNGLTEAIVCGGLEPLDSLMDLLAFVDTLRNRYHCNDDLVIYTGYTEDEVLAGNLKVGNIDVNKTFIDNLFQYDNIIIKYGRYVPNEQPHRDLILGVNLTSDNQYAKEYRKESILDECDKKSK